MTNDLNDWIRKKAHDLMGQAARWASTEGKELAKAGATDAAHHLSEAAKDFRAGKKDKALARMEKAATEAKTPQQAKVIENKTTEIQVGLTNVRAGGDAEVPKEELSEAARIMGGMVE